MKNKNVSAFPVSWVEKEQVSNGIKRTVYHSDGMSLRDWFAGQVMTTFIEADNREEECFQSGYDALAKNCYEYADAMMKAREK